MTMTVKGFEKVDGVACVVVSIPVDALFNTPALAPILDQLTTPDDSGAVLQDASVAPATAAKKPRKPRQKKATCILAAEAAPAVKHSYPDRKPAAVAAKVEKPAKVSQAAKTIQPATAEKSNNTNEAKMHSHCPHCKPEQFGTYKQWLAAGYKVKPGEHGVRLMGFSEVIVDGQKVKKPFFFTKFCACQVEAVAVKQVG